MSQTLGLGTDPDDIDDDVNTLNTNDTSKYMTPDGKCVHHSWVELRGKDLASGQVFQRESCPECNHQHRAIMDDGRQRKLELDRQLRELDNQNASVDICAFGSSNVGDAGSRGSVDRDRVQKSSESHSSHPQPYRLPLPPQSSSSSSNDRTAGYSYTQWQHPSHVQMAADRYGSQVVNPGPNRTSSSASASSSNQHMDVLNNGTLHNDANGTPTLPPFPLHTNPYDPQYLAAAANAFHHANISPATPSQHVQTRQDSQNDSFLWKLLQDKENELKDVRKTLQETQIQFQQQSLLATKLQTTLEQVQTAFEQERLLIKLQAEKEAQESLASQQQESYQNQLLWMEKNLTNNRGAQYQIQRNNACIGSSQHSDQNSIQSTGASIGKISTSEEELPSIHSNKNDREANDKAMGDALSSSTANVVTTNNSITTSGRKKDEKKYPWTGTTIVSPPREKRSITLVPENKDDDEKEDVNQKNSNRNTLKSPVISGSKKKLYPSIDETLMVDDVTDDNDLSNAVPPMPQPLSSSSAVREQQQQVVTVDSLALGGTQQTTNMAETPTINNTKYREEKTTNDSSGRFEPLYITQSADNEATGFPPPDDDRSLGQTVASSTYGDDRIKVVGKTLLDPYGDKGSFTGVVLRNTGMPHGQGEMVYEEDRRVFEGEWRHGRWHGNGRASFSNGDSYEGEYKFDQRHGTGLYRWNDGRVYNGQFSEDKRHGNGKFTWPDGAVYEGDFVNGQRQGNGKYTFADGGQYDGSWKDGRYDGIGTCTWEDGRCYRGEWRNGMAHGQGTETYPDGNIRHEGQWNDDEPVR